MATKTSTPPIPSSISWEGELERFAPLLEGGPGRPLTLALLDFVGLGLLLWGIHAMDQGLGGGPVFILFGALILGTVAFWILVKALLRTTRCSFLVDTKGIAIRPDKAQERLDNRLRWLMLIVFWLTLKGGQWATWKPFTRWSEVRSVKVFEAKRQILVTGGPWHIRLHCTEENFPTVLAMLNKQNARRKRSWFDKP